MQDLVQPGHVPVFGAKMGRVTCVFVVVCQKFPDIKTEQLWAIEHKAVKLTLM